MSVISLFMVLQLNGQYEFSGKVTDEKGNALIGANVSFKGNYLGTITDESGNFIFKTIKEGSYEVKVSYVGYKTSTRSIKIDEDLYLTFTLERSPYLVEEVIVRGIRAGQNDPVTTTTIDREEIEERNIIKDIPYVLKYSPSLVASSDAGHGVGYTGFRIRGTDANRINITIDGVPLNDAESHGVWWVNMPDFASSVENVQIQRGVGTSTNGSAAFGASLNFKTTNLKNKPYALLNSSYGSFNTRKNSLNLGSGMINDRFSFDLRLSEIHSDGYIDRAEADLQSLFLSAGHYSDKTIVKFNLIMGKEKTYQAWDGVPGYILSENRRYNGIGMYTDENGEIQYYDNETDNYRQNHYHLHFSHELTPDLWFNSTLHYTKGAGYYEQYKEEESLAEYLLPDIAIGDSIISNTDLIRQKWLDNDYYGIVFSLNMNKEKFDLNFGGGANQYIGDHFGEVIWARYAGISEIGHRWYENTGDKSDYNLYTKLNYRIFDQFRLYSDLQLRGINYRIEGIDDDQRNITQNHDFLFFNPKVGLNYRPGNKQRMYFSFAVANREPNRTNFVDADPNRPGPVHETLYNYELGYDLHLRNLRSNINFYYMKYDDQLVLTGEINDVGSAIMTNVEESYRLGVEFSGGIRLNRNVQWEGNLTLSRNRIKNMVSYVDNWDYWYDETGTEEIQIREEHGDTDIAFSPEIIASSIFSFNLLNHMKVSLQSKYVGKQYIDNTESEERKLDPYFVNDLLIDYNIPVKWSEELSVNLLIANLTDHEYESNAWIYRYYEGDKEQVIDGFYPQAGIHFMAGIKLGF